jgi:alpha-L-fucosidase
VSRSRFLGALALVLMPAITALVAPRAEPFKPTWVSLEKYEVPDWFRDAKFGLFVHWGPQTLAGGTAPADGSQSPWKDLAARFEGKDFDATQWAALFRKSGAKYVVQVAEHHDGYALYDSSHTRYSSVKMRPRRDFVGELSAAVRKEGLVWGASSHTEENWWFYADPPKRIPPLPKPGAPSNGEQPPREWLDDWYARLVEIVEKYDPDVFWFDWSIEQPAFEPYLRRFAAFYYNRAAKRGQRVVINYKYHAFPTRAAVLDVSVNTGRLSWKPEIPQELPWQFDTWSAKGLWFWRPGLVMRPTADLLAEMADVVSQNGNYLLNVTPDPNGAISAAQQKMLKEIGAWLAINGEAVYGSRPWVVSGEGPTSGLGSSFRADVPKTPYTARDVRYTRKGKVVYAIVLGWPKDGKVTLTALADDSSHHERDIVRVSVLGVDRAVRWSRQVGGLVVDVAALTLTSLPWVAKIELR